MIEKSFSKDTKQARQKKLKSQVKQVKNTLVNNWKLRTRQGRACYITHKMVNHIDRRVNSYPNKNRKLIGIYFSVASIQDRPIM